LQQATDLIEFYLQPNNWGWRGEFSLGDSGTARVIGDGIIELLPNTESQPLDLILSLGVHGNETAPIEVVSRLVERLRAGELTLATRTLILLANLKAIKAGTRFCQENMNRLFSGNHAKLATRCWESERAAELESAVAQFFGSAGQSRKRVHYDLHTAIRGSRHEKFAVAPYRQGAAIDTEQLSWLAAAGVEAVVQYHEPTSTFSYFSASQFAAQAFTVELGKARPFGENRLQDFAACELMLAGLLQGQLPQADPSQLAQYQVCRVINRNCDDFALAFADDLPNFTAFQQGQLLATDGDSSYLAEQNGEVIIFPNAKVQMGHRAALVAVPVKP